MPPVVVVMSSVTVSPALAMVRVVGMVAAAAKLKSRLTVWLPVAVDAIKDVPGRTVETK